MATPIATWRRARSISTTGRRYSPPIRPAPPAAPASRADDILVAADGRSFGEQKPAATASFGQTERALDGPRCRLRRRRGRSGAGSRRRAAGGAGHGGAGLPRPFPARAGRQAERRRRWPLHPDQRGAILLRARRRRARRDPGARARPQHPQPPAAAGRCPGFARDVQVDRAQRAADPRDRGRGRSAQRLSARSWRLFGRGGGPLLAPVRPEHGKGIFASPTHPGWKERVSIIEAEAAQLARLKQSDPRPIPPFLQAETAAAQVSALQVERNQRSAPSRPIAVSRPVV